MFQDRSELIQENDPRLHYGVAVSDVDGDGAFEWVVAGYGDPNRVLKWNGAVLLDATPRELRDEQRQAIGVAAGDLDGSGREALYFLNTDAFAGPKQTSDRLYVHRNGRWLDFFETPAGRSVANPTAGRSVVAIDRLGQGRYGFFVANYGGPYRLYEWQKGSLREVAADAGLAATTGGRGVVVVPLFEAKSDLFAVNEGGPNLYFRNVGEGCFVEIAEQLKLHDPQEHARGVAVLDHPEVEPFAFVVGNWEGLHRLYVDPHGNSFQNQATAAMAMPSRIRTVLVADFDNDGFQEIFFHNHGEPNRLFGYRGQRWTPIDLGEALEPDGLGTGGAVADVDGDGRLELLLARGEAAAQPLSLYHAPANGHHWLRILPQTHAGAPARGAKVTLQCAGRTQKRVIDGGSGYLGQMEPVAHFGLGNHSTVDQVTVLWPGNEKIQFTPKGVDQLIRVPFPTK